MVCVLFGHRDAPGEIIVLLKRKILELMRDYGDIEFFVGNNGNFDFISQKILREIALDNDSLKHYIVLSYINECALIGDNKDTLFPEGQELGLKRFAISRRNNWLLKKADIVLCYVKHIGTNSYELLKKAERRGVRILNVGQ